MTEKKDDLAPEGPLDAEMEKLIEAMERGGCPINDETLQFFYQFLQDVRTEQTLLDLMLAGVIHVAGIQGDDPLLVIDDKAAAFISAHYPWIRMEAPRSHEVN